MRIDFEITTRAKRTIGWVLLPIAVLAGTIAVAHAVGPINTSWIASGQPVKSSDLKQNLEDLQTQITARKTVTHVAALEPGTCAVAAATADSNWIDGSGPLPVAAGMTGVCGIHWAPGTFNEATQVVCTCNSNPQWDQATDNQVCTQSGRSPGGDTCGQASGCNVAFVNFDLASGQRKNATLFVSCTGVAP